AHGVATIRADDERGGWIAAAVAGDLLRRIQTTLASRLAYRSADIVGLITVVDRARVAVGASLRAAGLADATLASVPRRAERAVVTRGIVSPRRVIAPVGGFITRIGG